MIIETVVRVAIVADKPLNVRATEWSWVIWTGAVTVEGHRPVVTGAVESRGPAMHPP
jgi:hypothetical protein